MSLRVRSVPMLLAGGLMLAPMALSGQEPPPQQGQQQQTQTELVFEREVYDYPGFDRRNPFRPLVAADAGGPRFDQLRLVGIIFYDERPEASVAVLGTSQVEYSEEGIPSIGDEGQSWNLKEGETIGNVRIVEIHREQVVVDVEEFGLTDRKIMQLQTRRQGGTP